MTHQNLKVLLLAIGILVLATFSRVWELDNAPKGFINDEIQLANEGFQLLFSDRYQPFISQNRESTLPYLNAFLMRYFEFSPSLIRLPNAIAGAIMIVSIFLMFTSRMTPFIAFFFALCLSVSPAILSASRINLRVGLGAVALFTFIACYEYLYRSRKKSVWFLLGLIAGLGMHTYHAYRAMPLFLCILAIHNFWVKPKEESLRTWASKWSIFALAFLLVPVPFWWSFFESGNLLAPFHREESTFAIEKVMSVLPLFFENLIKMISGERFYFAWYNQVKLFDLLLIPFLIVGLVGLGKNYRKPLEFAILLAIPFFLLPALASGEFALRRLFYSIVAIYLCTCFGAHTVIDHLKKHVKKFVNFRFIEVAFVCVGLALTIYYTKSFIDKNNKLQWGFFYSQLEASRELSKHYKASQSIFVANVIHDPYILHPYLYSYDTYQQFKRDFQFIPMAEISNKVRQRCNSKEIFYVIVDNHTNMHEFQQLLQTCPNLTKLLEPSADNLQHHAIQVWQHGAKTSISH